MEGVCRGGMQRGYAEGVCGGGTWRGMQRGYAKLGVWVDGHLSGWVAGVIWISLIQINSENCISGTPKVSKYIAKLVGLIIFKNSGTNLGNTRDP